MLEQQEATINCPYCGALIDVLIDDSAGSQSYYEDCSVCCAPIFFIVTDAENGEIQIEVKRDDE